MFATLFPAIEKLTITQQWLLISNAIQRLNKVLEQIHDSGGFCRYIADELKQRLVVFFNAQPWSDEEKAQWIFNHTEEYTYDVFPDVPEDFELSAVRQIFLAKCLIAVEDKQQSGDLNDWDFKYSIQRLTRPLIEQAIDQGNWQEQCRLMNMSAVRHPDYLAIADVCLDNAAELDGEYWLQQATNLLLKLEKILKTNNIERTILYKMIAQMSQAYKQERNMMKLLQQHVAAVFNQ